MCVVVVSVLVLRRPVCEQVGAAMSRAQALCDDLCIAMRIYAGTCEQHVLANASGRVR